MKSIVMKSIVIKSNPEHLCSSISNSFQINLISQERKDAVKIAFLSLVARSIVV